MRLIVFFLTLSIMFVQIVFGQHTDAMSQKMVNVVKTGGAQMIPLDNGFQVWTKRVGDGPIKILMLHGGPGFTHECFECFEDFFPRDRFQLIYYDQLGSHYSDQPDDPSLWNIERFCSEVEQVRLALGLEAFYLYGYSWGGMLAIEYALKYQHHLKGLIISSMTASVASYEAHLRELRNRMPHSVLHRLQSYEKIGDTDNPEYQNLMFENFYKRHMCRLESWPEPVLRTMRHFNQRVSDAVFGPDDFTVTGNCQHWNRWDDLSSIKVPTLLISGLHDTMSPEDIKKMGSLIPHSKVTICENGSHLSMYDDQETYFHAIHDFMATPSTIPCH